MQTTTDRYDGILVIKEESRNNEETEVSFLTWLFQTPSQSEIDKLQKAVANLADQASLEAPRHNRSGTLLTLRCQVQKSELRLCVARIREMLGRILSPNMEVRELFAS